MSPLIEYLKNIDYSDIIEEKIIGNIVGKAINGVKNIFTKASDKIDSIAKKSLQKNDYEYFSQNYDFDIEESVILRRIANNIKLTNNWSKEIYFNTALTSKKLDKVFVEIDLYLSPLKFRFDTSEQTEKVPASSILRTFEKNIIIYGGVGAGKTTFIKKICSDYFEKPGEHPFACPIVIRFREIDYENHNYGNHFGLFPILIDTLGIQIKFPFDRIDKFYNEYKSLLQQTIVSFLDDGKILLIADGFDEIPILSVKHRIMNEFNDLALSLDHSRFILTSRSNDFALKLPRTSSYEICPLNNEQIKKVINNWLNNKKQSEDLFNKIKNSPFYDTTMRPLTLSHLCAIYERRKTIPPKPRYVYDFVLNLLLESWDQQRSIIRPSEYAEFYIEKKKEFLANLAFWFTHHLSKNVFTTDELRKCYNEIHKIHNLPRSQAKKVVTELENHTGLFVQVGYNSFEFSHKSMQEFLTAKYIYSLAKIPDFELLKYIPNELAIAICLSSSPNIYFYELLKEYNKYTEEFWNAFFSRLIEEIPDFNHNPSVIIFLFNGIQQLHFPIFRKALKALLELTNLEISIKSFYKEYPLRENYFSQTRFTHGTLNKSVLERNYYPGVLIVDNDIVDMLKLAN